MSEDLKDLGFQSLDDLGFVSEDQVQQPKRTSKPGIGEATLRSIAQGAAFGGADEATAALEALATGKPYQQALEESRRNYKAAEEEHPIASFIGNLGGGVVGAAGLGEALGSLGLLGKLAGTAAEAPKALTALQKMHKLGKIGAGYGALTGLGTSEASLVDKPLDVAKDVATSAGTAYLGGAALSGLGQVGSKVGSKIADEVGFIKRPVDAFKLGVEGKSLLSKSDISSLEKTAAEKAAEVSKNLRESLNFYSGLKNSILENSSSKKTPRDVSRLFDKITNKIQSLNIDEVSSQDKDKLLGLLDKYKQVYTIKAPVGTGASDVIKISPEKLNALRQGFQAYTSAGENSLQTKAARNIALDAVDRLGDTIENSLTNDDVITGIIYHTWPELHIKNIHSVDELEYANQAFKQIYSSLEKKGLSNELVKSFNSKMHDILTVQDLLNVKSTPNAAEELQNNLNLAKLFNREAAETEGGVSARQKLSAVEDILHNKKPTAEQQKFPALFKEDALKNAFDEASKAGEAVENVRYSSGKVGSGPAALLGIADVATTQGANAIGYITKWGNYLYDADPKAFQMLSSKIKNTSGENILTRAFDKLAQTSDVNKKRAMLNTMMQTPIYRAMIHKFGDTMKPTSEENPSGSPTE